VDWQGRAHFFAIAARAMHPNPGHHARYRRASKRAQAAEWQRSMTPISPSISKPIACSRSRRRSQARAESARMGQVVECRFFAAMTEEDAPAALRVSLRTVQRDWMQGPRVAGEDAGRVAVDRGAGMNVGRRLIVAATFEEALVCRQTRSPRSSTHGATTTRPCVTR
jgi:hypothetical protein